MNGPTYRDRPTSPESIAFEFDDPRSHTTPLRERPFVRAHFSRQLRKFFGMRFRLTQIPEAEYDQLIAKCRNAVCLDALCDFADNDLGFNLKSMNPWFTKNMDVLRELAGEFDDVSLTAPELYYNIGPKMRGRKAIRAAGPKYQTDEAFQADKEAFEKEMREER